MSQRLLFILPVKLSLGRTGIVAIVLLLLNADDIRRALITGKQILAVLGIEKSSQSFNAAHDQQKVVLVSKREYCINQIMVRALLPELHL